MFSFTVDPRINIRSTHEICRNILKPKRRTAYTTTGHLRGESVTSVKVKQIAMIVARVAEILRVHSIRVCRDESEASSHQRSYSGNFLMNGLNSSLEEVGSIVVFAVLPLSISSAAWLPSCSGSTLKSNKRLRR
jgi:hypothetical protein